MNITKDINSKKSKWEHGFISEEIEKIYAEYHKKFPNMNREKFDSALYGITCQMNGDPPELVIYHCDIINALHCAIDNRDLNLMEWD